MTYLARFTASRSHLAIIIVRRSSPLRCRHFILSRRIADYHSINTPHGSLPLHTARSLSRHLVIIIVIWQTVLQSTRFARKRTSHSAYTQPLEGLNLWNKSRSSSFDGSRTPPRFHQKQCLQRSIFATAHDIPGANTQPFFLISGEYQLRCRTVSSTRTAYSKPVRKTSTLYW